MGCGWHWRGDSGHTLLLPPNVCGVIVTADEDAQAMIGPVQTVLQRRLIPHPPAHARPLHVHLQQYSITPQLLHESASHQFQKKADRLTLYFSCQECRHPEPQPVRLRQGYEQNTQLLQSSLQGHQRDQTLWSLLLAERLADQLCLGFS